MDIVRPLEYAIETKSKFDAIVVLTGTHNYCDNAKLWQRIKRYINSSQSDSSIFSISSREGPPGEQTLYSPLEKLDLLFSPNSWARR